LLAVVLAVQAPAGLGQLVYVFFEAFLLAAFARQLIAELVEARLQGAFLAFVAVEVFIEDQLHRIVAFVAGNKVGSLLFRVEFTLKPMPVYPGI